MGEGENWMKIVRMSEKAMAPHSSTLAWKIPWTEDLVACGPWGRKEWNTTEQLHFHFSLSCIGEGNGHPLQCSCLENPRDGGSWWAAIYGVAQSQTRLKGLSSSKMEKNSSLIISLYSSCMKSSIQKYQQLNCFIICYL